MKTYILAAFAAALAAPAFAAPPLPSGVQTRSYEDLPADDSLLNDVYVRLYMTRYKKSKLQIEIAKVQLSEAIRRRDRMEPLYQSHAVSAEELDTVRKEVDVAALAVQGRENEAEESKTFLDIAVTRISLGLEMPICAQLQ